MPLIDYNKVKEEHINWKIKVESVFCFCINLLPMAKLNPKFIYAIKIFLLTLEIGYPYLIYIHKLEVS